MKFLLKSIPTVMDGAYGREGGVRDYTERQLPRKEGAHTKEEVKQKTTQPGRASETEKES